MVDCTIHYSHNFWICNSFKCLDYIVTSFKMTDPAPLSFGPAWTTFLKNISAFWDQIFLSLSWLQDDYNLILSGVSLPHCRQIGDRPRFIPLTSPTALPLHVWYRKYRMTKVVGFLGWVEVFHHPVWAVGSCYSGPPARATSLIYLHPTQACDQQGHPVVSGWCILLRNRMWLRVITFCTPHFSLEEQNMAAGLWRCGELNGCMQSWFNAIVLSLIPISSEQPGWCDTSI